MKTQTGSAAVISLSTVLVLLVVSGGVASLSIGTIRRAGREATISKTMQAAQAGLELQISRSHAEMRTNLGRFINEKNNLSSDLYTLAPGMTLTTLVTPLANPKTAYVTSTATYLGVSRSVRALVKVDSYSIWDNAIFAGKGSTGNPMTGNTNIRGSVHLLGDGEAYQDLNGNGMWDPAETFTDKNKNKVWDPGEPFNDSNGDGVCNTAEPFQDANGNKIYEPPLTIADISTTLAGSSFVGNNYRNMPTELRSRITDPPIVNGLETLEAKFRVKHGRIALSGNGAIGEPNDKTYKGTMDGVFVNDGFAGTKGKLSVYSDNGTTNQYDLEHLKLKHPFISGFGAEQYIDSKGVVWTNQAAFLDANSLTIPVRSITTSTPAFTYGPDLNGNAISWTPSTKTTQSSLVINGIIRIDGDLTLGLPKEITYYSGRGTIYATNDVFVESGLLPSAGLLFPTTTVIGLIAGRNLNLSVGSGASQNHITGALYAQGVVRSYKQNEIAGTFVGNEFDMGVNVPRIYQVPSLIYNMPPAMPGDNQSHVVRRLSWRERAPK